ncbi:MAG TPA: hypothetical protein VGI88_15940 [Verrucomicrobiae bacterium]|jgi:hypothetical protein
MNTFTKSVLVIGVATLAATTMYAKSSKRQGTEVVHFSAHVTFTNSGAESGSASGQLSEAIQGNADHESLTVTAKLLPSTTYDLNATTVSNSSPTLVDEFTTDKKGNAKVSVSNSGKGKKSVPFPDGILPLTGVTELDIVDTGTSTTVLTAGADQTSKVKYMVKKPMDDTAGNGETGTIDLSASDKGGKASLAASSLSTSTDYVLVVNGNPVSTNTPSSKGTLKISQSASSSDILNANTVELDDATTGATILTATVP